MSSTKLEDSLSRRNWSSASELNETQEPFLNPTDYDDEEFLRYLWREYLHPKEYEWVLIAGYIIVFVVALIGNVLGLFRFPPGHLQSHSYKRSTMSRTAITACGPYLLQTLCLDKLANNAGRKSVPSNDSWSNYPVFVCHFNTWHLSYEKNANYYYFKSLFYPGQNSYHKENKP
ncbi:hypothetical protein STEG23_007499 [Scotinomys teguina]